EPLHYQLGTSDERPVDHLVVDNSDGSAFAPDLFKGRQHTPRPINVVASWCVRSVYALNLPRRDHHLSVESQLKCIQGVQIRALQIANVAVGDIDDADSSGARGSHRPTTAIQQFHLETFQVWES